MIIKLKCAKCNETFEGSHHSIGKMHTAASMEPVTCDGRVAAVVQITFSREWGDYRVPSPEGREAEAYYTDDEEDARGTCLHVWGAANVAEIKIVRRNTHPKS